MTELKTDERGHLNLDKIRNYTGSGFLLKLWEAIKHYGTACENHGYGDGTLKDVEEAEDKVYEMVKTLEIRE